jgi:hypothetical protein
MILISKLEKFEKNQLNQFAHLVVREGPHLLRDLQFGQRQVVLRMLQHPQGLQQLVALSILSFHQWTTLVSLIQLLSQERNHGEMLTVLTNNNITNKKNPKTMEISISRPILMCREPCSIRMTTKDMETKITTIAI